MNKDKTLRLTFDGLYWHLEVRHWLWGWRTHYAIPGNMKYSNIIKAASSFGYDVTGLAEHAKQCIKNSEG